MKTNSLRCICFVIMALFATSIANSRTLEIGPGKEYATLNAAAAAAQPGDTITFATGVHSGGAHVTALQGTKEKWIIIRGDGNMTSVIRGGANAIQLSDPAYLRIEGLVFEEQTGNGMNIDDGGTIESPAHHIVIEGCEWRSIAASGNNDMLKMSGIDSFWVTGCKFTNGAAGGSMIDMVGCHFGEFADNHFEDAGSNCIQAKGGTSEIVIQRNRFIRGGQRAVNIGGSTGLEFFRPLGATYEARSINVWSNIIVGGVSSVAFVGAIDSKVINNTIIEPERWAIRILQESVDGFQPCGNNSFINNIVVTSSAQPAINIGGNTAPETFTFSHNLWYNPDNESWNGPNTPVTEPGRILNQDPQLSEIDHSLSPTSPARAAGLVVTQPDRDLFNRPFASPRSIGAAQFESLGVNFAHDETQVKVFPNPVSDRITIEALGNSSQIIEIVDILGRAVWSGAGAEQYTIDASLWVDGYYCLVIGQQTFSILKR